MGNDCTLEWGGLPCYDDDVYAPPSKGEKSKGNQRSFFADPEVDMQVVIDDFTVIYHGRRKCDFRPMLVDQLYAMRFGGRVSGYVLPGTNGWYATIQVHRDGHYVNGETQHLWALEDRLRKIRTDTEFEDLIKIVPPPDPFNRNKKSAKKGAKGKKHHK